MFQEVESLVRVVYFHHMDQGLSQMWANYTPDHHDTWRRLYERQRANLEGKASPLRLELDRWFAGFDLEGNA